MISYSVVFPLLFPKLTYYPGLFLIFGKRPFTPDDGLEVKRMAKPVAKCEIAASLLLILGCS